MNPKHASNLCRGPHKVHTLGSLKTEGKIIAPIEADMDVSV